MTPDNELLRRYAETGAEEAFGELVRRHVNLVYSAALRQVGGDAHLAQDVAQTVFTDLARKARSLLHRETLTGWLYTSAHYAAAKIVRTDHRRREREGKFMREPTYEAAPGADWENIRPLLDDAMHKLRETDREAILLRYFENRSFTEVGTKLGLGENAARMRVERALEKLRGILSKRGITTATALASMISANAVQMAPANVVASLAAASLATAGAGTTTFTLFKIMTATQLKLGIGALVVAGTAAVLVVQQQAQKQLRQDNALLQQQVAQLQTDNEYLSNRLSVASDSRSPADERNSELLRLRGEVGVLRQQTNELERLRQENRQLQALAAANTSPTTQLTAADEFKLRQMHVQEAVSTLMDGVKKYAAAHRGEFPTNYDQLDGSGNPGTNIFAGGLGPEDFVFLNPTFVGFRGLTVIIQSRDLIPSPDGNFIRILGTMTNGVPTVIIVNEAPSQNSSGN